MRHAWLILELSLETTPPTVVAVFIASNRANTLARQFTKRTYIDLFGYRDTTFEKAAAHVRKDLENPIYAWAKALFIESSVKPGDVVWTRDKFIPANGPINTSDIER